MRSVLWRTGYRARTRFAKFFNLPELMNLFKEVADIKTADQLHLPCLLYTSSEAEQIQSIAAAESVTPSAFSMFLSQNDIDHILRAGGNADAARMKICLLYTSRCV